MKNPVSPGNYDIGDQLAQDALAEEMPSPEEAPAAVEGEDELRKEPEIQDPLVRWKKNLEAAKITVSQADAILDQMLKTGYWEKEYTLFRGRLKIKLRTRDAYSLQRTANAVDQLRTNDPRVRSQTLFRLSLAGSLVMYGGTQLALPPRDAEDAAIEQAFNERLQFIDKGIPEFVASQLYFCVENFDTIARAALSEGAATGF